MIGILTEWILCDWDLDRKDPNEWKLSRMSPNDREDLSDRNLDRKDLDDQKELNGTRMDLNDRGGPECGRDGPK
ncbi:hypothetical protein CDL15_Pgr002694 [Punica granatum]|uniref:Uncharacterized protein n=1 Tax=Punica granatum TaxID=22663 RepID=A0A218Y1T4_PUNGR|nr:hypothetical protein CDL15_Pgr002694 [Punica granatum]